MPLEPACSIDYREDTRRFSLPIGVPPNLSETDLQDYINKLDIKVNFFFYDTQVRDAFNPQSPKQKRVRLLASNGGNVFLPFSTWLPVALTTSDKNLEKSDIDMIGKASWTAAKVTTGKTLAQVVASTFRWDDDARKASHLPMPIFTDESLVIYWKKSATSGGGVITTPIPGVLSDDHSHYLLATSTGTPNGELDRLLIRAPAHGLVRFERYRHILMKGSNLEVSHPSKAGALFLKILPAGLTPSEFSPLFKENMVVFENVDIDAAINCLSSLVVCLMLHLSEILKLKKFNKEVIKQLSWLFRSWLAYLRVIRPVKRPADPNPYSDISPALRSHFETRNNSDEEHVKALLDHILGTAAAKMSIIDYIISFYTPVICGKSWHELDVDIPVTPDRRPTPLVIAHAILEELPSSSETWLICYSGCPLGKPSSIYFSDPLAPPEPKDMPLGSFTTFELEAIMIAGKITSIYSDIPSPVLPDVLDPIDLSAFDEKSTGLFCVFRSLDKTPPKQEYTTFDWLAEVIKGENRQEPQEPMIDFEKFAGAGHPLAEPLYWDLFMQGHTVRNMLNQLDNAKISVNRLDDSNLIWWKNKTGIAVDGKWPSVLPFDVISELPAGPERPFSDGKTMPLNVPSGLDIFDIQAALIAQRFVLNGKNPVHHIELALILALMDREGYRFGAFADRVGSNDTKGWIDFHKIVDPITNVPRHPKKGDFGLAVPPPGSPVAIARFLDATARIDWILFPFGLDVFNKDAKIDATFVSTVKSSFVNRIVKLQGEDVLKDIDPTYTYQFALNRLRGRFKLPDETLQNQRRSRRLQWLGITCQQAEFQGVHNRLHHASDPSNQFDEVDELVDADIPEPGPDANSVERRRYIAYYALVYLAFNTKPKTWNDWVKAADQHRGSESISTFLLYHTNSKPRDLEPSLAGESADPRHLFQRANMLRFAVALDAYLRINVGDTEIDDSNPNLRTTW